VILYQALAGRLPFSGNTFNELLFKIVTEDPPALTALVPGLDPVLGRIVERAMVRDRAQRFESAEALIVELDGWASAAGLEVPRLSSFPSPLSAAAEPAAPGAPSPIQGTGSSWATSHHDRRAARSGWPAALGAAALGALLLGGGSYAAYRILSPDELTGASPPPASGLPIVSSPAGPASSHLRSPEDAAPDPAKLGAADVAQRNDSELHVRPVAASARAFACARRPPPYGPSARIQCHGKARARLRELGTERGEGRSAREVAYRTGWRTEEVSRLRVLRVLLVLGGRVLFERHSPEEAVADTIAYTTGLRERALRPSVVRY
jgi:hypothetical protein